MEFNKWLKTFVEEKGIDLEQTFELPGPSGTNFFSYGVVIEHLYIASSKEKAHTKEILIKIDFKNGDVLHFLRHIAQGLVK